MSVVGEVRQGRGPSAARLEDYALIGDCETAALVSRAGSVDWLCWPRFDSGACFASLLGGPEHGRWLIEPVDQAAQRQRRYRDGTLILETSIETDGGRATLIDFMPPRGANSDLVRIVKGDRGTVRFRSELVLRFDYGRSVPWVTRLDSKTISAIAGPDLVTFYSTVPSHGKDLTTVSEFEVAAGKTVSFVLTQSPSHLRPPVTIDPASALRRTRRFWRDWSSKGEFEGPYEDLVRRSLITLKALTYAPTGGIVAAPTSSLPEELGGSRNWDYRYCWLRDATLTLLALMNSGHVNEAASWRDWLLRAAAGAPAQLQIMYGIGGERRLPEWRIPWLPGYERSAPVRVGNAAEDQLQLDVFGEVMDTMAQARRNRIAAVDTGWQFQRELLEHLAEIWRQPDHGLWEVRGAPRHFTHSKVMAWVAFDRGVRAIESFKLEGPLAEWRRIRSEIHADVCAHGFDPGLGSFVRSYGASDFDASLLLIPTVGFLPASDARVRGTVAAVERHLLRDGFVLRYDPARAGDGLPGGEGAFLACSFWLADAYVLMNRFDDAQRLFERLVGLCNDVGLLAEEYDPRNGRLVGNFPQAFSHVALVNTAHNLMHARKPVRQRAGVNHVAKRQPRRSRRRRRSA
jgi:GH15 family glucan-1,4-alpha-glucosidase